MVDIKSYQLVSDANYYRDGIVLPTPEYVDVYILAGGTVQDVTVPVGARVAIFSATGNFYVNWLTTATVPSANVTNGAGAELNPVAREVGAVASYSIISPANCVVTVAYFS